MNAAAQRLRQAFRIVLSISLIAAGLCLMAGCLYIYNTGDAEPYTPERISAVFNTIAIPVYLALGLILAGFILEGCFPAPKKKLSAKGQVAMALQRAVLSRDLSISGPTLRSDILAQRRSRTVHQIVALVLLLLGSVIFLVYGLNPANFHPTDITDSMIKAVLILLACLAVPFIYSIVAAYLARRSMQKEIELLKMAQPRTSDLPSKKVSFPWKQVLQYSLILGGLGLLIGGFLAGGAIDVLTKAVNICTECVGLG